MKKQTPTLSHWVIKCWKLCFSASLVVVDMGRRIKNPKHANVTGVAVGRKLSPARLGDVAIWKPMRRSVTSKFTYEYLCRPGLTRVTKRDLPAATTTTKENGKDPITSMFSVGLRPTARQKVILEKQIETARVAHNWCVWLVTHNVDIKWLRVIVACRKVCMLFETHLAFFIHARDRDAFFDGQLNVKIRAIDEFIESYRVDEQCHRKSGGHAEGCFGIRYVRPFDRDRDPIDMTDRKIVCLSVGAPKKRHAHYIKIRQCLDRLPPLQGDMRVVKRVDGTFILQIPCDANKYMRRSKRKSRNNNNKVASIDPGVRTFATIYDATDDHCYQVGTWRQRNDVLKNIDAKLEKAHATFLRAKNADKDQAARDGFRETLKLGQKLRHKVRAMHIAFASDLVSHYGTVIVGDYDVGKRLPTHRWATVWRHADFRRRLLHRAKGTTCEVIIQNEAYTSKTCSQCDKINVKLGGLEVFKCANCGYNAHRDLNGAVNILRKRCNLM